MATPVIMPKFGQMTEESAIVEWLKKEGDKVAKGDILFTVETDKSVMDVESFEEGTLLKIVVPPRVTVPVQSTVAFLGKPGEAVPTVTAPAAQSKPAVPAPVAAAVKPVQAAAPVAATVAAAPAPVMAASQSAVAPAFQRISPRAAALARDCVIDPAQIKGTGPEGRVVEKDVRNYLQARGYERLRVTPSAKALAAKEKLDLLAIAGGAEGRIGVAEVERALAERPRTMSKMRQIIAQRLTQSVVTAPHFFVTVEADMTELVRFRAQLKEKGAPFTVTDFISEAAVLTLKEFPEVNSTTDGKSVRWAS
jgi:pyruvate dehydrogenase E2 component (dihydrolipoamide acetyltransferase)